MYMKYWATDNLLNISAYFCIICHLPTNGFSSGEKSDHEVFF